MVKDDSSDLETMVGLPVEDLPLSAIADEITRDTANLPDTIKTQMLDILALWKKT